MRGAVGWVVGEVCIPLYCRYPVRRRGRGASSGGRIRAPPSGHVPRPPGPRSPCPGPLRPTATPRRDQPGRGHPLAGPAAALPGQSPFNRIRSRPHWPVFSNRPLRQRPPPNLPRRQTPGPQPQMPPTDGIPAAATQRRQWQSLCRLQPSILGNTRATAAPRAPPPNAASSRPSRKTAAPTPAGAVPRRRPLPLNAAMPPPCPAASSVE